jgi:uncharacterized protein
MIVCAIFLAAWAAFSVSAVAGGGAGLVLVPLLRLLVPIAGVPAALSIGTASSSLSRLILLRRSIRWDVTRRFVPAALPFAALGAWLLSRFEPVYIELILGLFLLANLPALFRKVKDESAAPRLAMGYVPGIGALAGLLSGFTGAVGLLFNNIYYRLGMTRHEVVATRAANEVCLHLLKLLIYAGLGLLDRNALIAGLMVAAAAVLASLTTRWILPLLSESLFRRVSQVAMVAAGIAMFSLSSRQIAAIHQGWLSLVSPPDEQEVQLFWGGVQRFALEKEAAGNLALERSIDFEALPSAVRSTVLGRIPREAIVLVEQVLSREGLGYEVYYMRRSKREKLEIGAA